MKKDKKVRPSFATGVDIEDINRFDKMAVSKKSSSLKTIYTLNEIKYCFTKRKPSQHLAVRFCAKEAVIKALKSFGITAYYRDIEIKNEKSGLPKVKVVKKSIPKNLEISISLSHCKDKAIAFVVVAKM